jgi:hypothetical protein
MTPNFALGYVMDLQKQVTKALKSVRPLRTNQQRESRVSRCRQGLQMLSSVLLRLETSLEDRERLSVIKKEIKDIEAQLQKSAEGL